MCAWASRPCARENSALITSTAPPIQQTSCRCLPMPGSRPHAPHWPRSSTERRELSAIGRDRCARLIGTGLANRGAEQRAPNKLGPKDENGMTESEGSGEKTESLAIRAIRRLEPGRRCLDYVPSTRFYGECPKAATP